MKKKRTLPYFYIIAFIICSLNQRAYSFTPEYLISLNKANLHVQNWQPMEAIKLLNSINIKDKEEPNYYFILSRAHFFLGNYTEAKIYIDRFMEIEKKWKDIDGAARLKGLIYNTLDASEGFTKIDKGHFSIRFKKGKDRILIEMALDTLEKSYNEIGKKLGYFPKDTVRVEIYPSSDTFIKASGIPKDAVETSGTCALCNYNKILITSPRSTLRGYRWQDTLCHEYVHYVVYKKAGYNVPLWMQEGLAKYLEKSWRKNSRKELNPGDEDILARRLADNTLIKFSQMVPSFAFLKDSQDVRLAFAQVMTIIEYLDNKKGMKAIQSLLKGISTGDSFSDVLSKVYSMTQEEMLSGWKAYLAEKGLKEWPSLQYENVIFTDPDDEEQKDETDKIQTHSKDVKKFVSLGNMLRARERIGAALIEYEKAKAALKADDPVIENKLAMTHMLAGNISKAVSILKAAKKKFPNFVTTYSNLGKIYADGKDYTSAKNHFEEALEINPFNPAIYSHLIPIYRYFKQYGKEKETKRLLSLLLKDSDRL